MWDLAEVMVLCLMLLHVLLDLSPVNALAKKCWKTVWSSWGSLVSSQFLYTFVLYWNSHLNLGKPSVLWKVGRISLHDVVNKSSNSSDRSTFSCYQEEVAILEKLGCLVCFMKDSIVAFPKDAKNGPKCRIRKVTFVCCFFRTSNIVSLPNLSTAAYVVPKNVLESMILLIILMREIKKMRIQKEPCIQNQEIYWQ